MEEKDLQRLLDMLYGMVDEAKSAPFSAEKCTINRDEALDIITEIRSRMPIEIKKAQELIRAREEYIASAKKEVASGGSGRQDHRVRERNAPARPYEVRGDHSPRRGAHG